jgi:hypothetical protein
MSAWYNEALSGPRTPLQSPGTVRPERIIGAMPQRHALSDTWRQPEHSQTGGREDVRTFVLGATASRPTTRQDIPSGTEALQRTGAAGRRIR